MRANLALVFFLALFAMQRARSQGTLSVDPHFYAVDHRIIKWNVVEEREADLRRIAALERRVEDQERRICAMGGAQVAPPPDTGWWVVARDLAVSVNTQAIYHSGLPLYEGGLVVPPR